MTVEEALLFLKKAPFEDIGYAKVDSHRAIRQGVAEVIFGAGKTAEQMIGIVEQMKKNGQKTLRPLKFQNLFKSPRIMDII